MMKWLLLIGICMLLLACSDKIVEDDSNILVLKPIVIPDVPAPIDVSFMKNKSIGKTKFTYIYNRKLLGFEKIYKIINFTQQSCTSFISNVTGKNVTSCENITTFSRVIDTKAPKIPIYDDEIVAIKVNNETYDCDKKCCYVCDGIIVCLSKKDGYSPNRAEEFRCVLRSGESGWIKNLTSGKILESRSNVGVVI